MSRLTYSEARYFKEVAAASQINLEESEELIVITQGQALVGRDLEQNLKEHELYPNNVPQFIGGLKKLCEDDETFFQKTLSNTVLKNHNGDDINVQQDSIFCIFLTVNSIHDEILEILLDKLLKDASDETEDLTFINLILKSLRFLKFVKYPEKLTSKLVDAVEVSNYPTQLEILQYFPDIIPDDQWDEASKQLSKLLEDNENLAGPIIDCMNAFDLSSEALNSIQQFILEQLLGFSQYYKIFPILLDFLISNAKPDEMINILLKIRGTLDNIMGSDEKNLDSIKVLIYERIKILTNKIFTSYISMLGTIRDKDAQKPSDILLLFILHSVQKIDNTKKKLIENVFKKKIKSGFFTINLFEETFEKYFAPQIYTDVFESIMQIAFRLQKNIENSLLDTAMSIYKVLFIHRYSTILNSQDVIFSLMDLIGSSETKNATPLLRAIYELSCEAKMKPHAPQIMRLLEVVDYLELEDVKLIFEILCYLTCRLDSGVTISGLKDEIHMIVRKKLSECHKDTGKDQGIISAVVMAKHLASVFEDQEDLDDTITNLGDIPRGPAQEAASILELVQICVKPCPRRKVLFYDQLSDMIVSCDKLDKYFLSWMFETITQSFQDTFLVETAIKSFNGMDFSVYYELNDRSRMQQEFSVNIAELCMDLEKNNEIANMAPLFRLLRVLHQKQNNKDLSSIDALLGCGVILPDVHNYENFELDQLKFVTNCIFHCINWFREVISGFCTQPSKSIRSKVITRLNNLIELEDLLTKCMEIIPNYKLPVSYVENSKQRLTFSPGKRDGKVTKPPTKKFKSNSIVQDVSTMATSTQVKSTQSRKTATHKVEFVFKFRELDTDILILLKYSVNISESTDASTPELDLQQFQFILGDVISKLDVLMNRKSIGLSHLNVVNVIDLIDDCRKLIPSIHKQTTAIVKKIGEIIESNENLTSKELKDLKISLSLVLEFYHLIFGWKGFQNDIKYYKLLEDCLKNFQSEQVCNQLISFNQLIKTFFEILYSYIDNCLLISSAVCATQIMLVLYNMCPLGELKKLLVSASERLLKRQWKNLEGEPETGKHYYENLDKLIKTYLMDAKIKTICGLVGTLQNEAETLLDKTAHLNMFDSINKASFHVFYRALCTALSEQIKVEVANLTNREHLVLWKTTALTMQGLMSIGITLESRLNSSWFLRKSILILKVFLSHGIPILEIMLRSRSEDVVEILKTLQCSTRYLHKLCCHSKVNKDIGIINMIPSFSLILETIVYRVKAALIANNCSEAFWMGNLKNRNLHDQDISSQSSTSTSNTNVEDEELPLQSDDEDLSYDASINTSASDVF